MAKGKFGQIECRFWEDAKLAAMGNDVRLLMAYLLTCRHKNIVGSYRLPAGYAMADLRWSPMTWDDAWSVIKQSDNPPAIYDDAQQWLLLPNYIKRNAITGEKQIIGVINSINDMPDNPHNSYVVDMLTKYVDGFENHRHLLERCGSAAIVKLGEMVTIQLADGSDYNVLADHIEELSGSHPDVSVLVELKKCASWNKANPSKRKTLKGINRHITNWLLSAAKNKTQSRETVADANKKALASALNVMGGGR